MFWFPLVLGACTVLQAGLNRRISSHLGIPGAAFLNAIILVCSIGIFFGVHKFQTGTSPDLSRFSWWWLLPGLFGMTLVMGIPFAIARIGAFQVFIGIIAAQLLTSMLWDAWMEATPIRWSRVVGAILALLGGILATLR